MNNEVVGISAELAIADAFGVYVKPEYRQRGDEEIKNSLMNCVIDAFEKEGLPIPIKHVAEKQSLIDFELEDGSTLSVKTNKTRLDNQQQRHSSSLLLRNYNLTLPKLLIC